MKKNYAMMKKGLILFAALLALMGCNLQKKGEKGDALKASKYLVVYYSQTGATQKVANELVRLLNADTLRIDVEQPYDGTYQETIERCKKEMSDNELPQLRKLETDISKYDVIFLGYPIWFGTYALPIASLVKDIDFSGKKIVPFCTFGSGGLEASMDDLKKALPKAEILPGYGVRNARITKAAPEIEYFLKANRFLKGEVEKYPEYSEQKPVNEDDINLFNAACSSYQYPLGSPLTVGKRETSKGVDYRFIVQNKDAQGKSTEATIYITVSKESGAKPEFTKVVR